jgi:hypothetical protein
LLPLPLPPFCFGNYDNEFDGKCSSNDDGNGSGDDLSFWFMTAMTIVAILYFFTMKEIDGGGEEVVVVFAMAMTMAMLTMPATVTTTTMIDYWLLLESNGVIAVIIYFLFIFNDNARENLLATKVIGGGRAKVGWFFWNVYGDSDGDGNDNNSDD